MASPTPAIELQQVHKRFAGGLLALQDVSLRVARGEFVALLGPSGCGKSTVLRLVAGLDAASGGQLQAPALQPGGDGTTAFVFQQPTLMPWASAFDNVWLPLRLQGVPRSTAAPRVRQVLAGVGLAEFEHAYPAELSGGMQMRASIARALVTQPQLLLMDEPFAALDDITRRKLNTDLLQWWQGQPGDAISALFVTHSVTEAVFLSQRVLVMSARPGRIVAEVAVPEPYPRTQAFRLTPTFADACRALGQALELAHAPLPSTAASPA
ncbi:ABC transporter ATP-binding protein [Aquabacterium sp.]|uniref:ABC transporter ATP-binding protein n=1 Tax=Aquabacterium sp. TaxID=1872578 RepID=UPI002C0B4A54|nr:ABC transporter ATP-binding protein [Aquabacterium sp.]HSW04182.1 ABC transporter ATP-binding protein [Aquabacterium sp.]